VVPAVTVHSAAPTGGPTVLVSAKSADVPKIYLGSSPMKGVFTVRAYDHPEWCARGHKCNLGEHRSLPNVVELDGVGKVLVTRVLSRNGRERMEMTGSMYLAPTAHDARRQVNQTLNGFAAVMNRAATAVAA
jgi:hypothetical protein